MNSYRLSGALPMLLAAALLAACATPPPSDGPVSADGAAPAAVVGRPGGAGRVDESSMLPLLGYGQLLSRMSPAELARERRVLAAIPQSPATQVRLAMLLGQPRGATDLPRALGLLERVQKSGEPAALSLFPLVQTLAGHYQERQRLQAQNDKLGQQLAESLRRSVDLQLKLDALADLERSLPVRPTGGANLPESVR
jgi:hypothetical protein